MILQLLCVSTSDIRFISTGISLSPLPPPFQDSFVIRLFGDFPHQLKKHPVSVHHKDRPGQQAQLFDQHAGAPPIGPSR